MNEPDIYYVREDKTFGAATELPEGAYQITRDVYELLQLNPEYLDIRIQDNVVHLTVSLISYKRSAVIEVQKLVGNVMPSKQRMDHLMQAVITQQGCFDSEEKALLNRNETRELLRDLVAHQNKVLYLGHKHETRINESGSPQEVDSILESFENLIGKL